MAINKRIYKIINCEERKAVAQKLNKNKRELGPSFEEGIVPNVSSILHFQKHLWIQNTATKISAKAVFWELYKSSSLPIFPLVDVFQGYI